MHVHTGIVMVISTLVNVDNKCRMAPELLHAIMLECKSTNKGQVSHKAKHLVTYANDYSSNLLLVHKYSMDLCNG